MESFFTQESIRIYAYKDALIDSMGTKVRVNITLDDEVVYSAKELGLNISKVCENALILAIEAMKRVYNNKDSTSSSISSSQEYWWAGEDLNHRPPPRKGGVLTRLDDRPLSYER
jgi:post-segregation antitoxin (ccd killing protein)